MAAVAAAPVQAEYSNPISGGADPHVVYHGGNYYFLRTTGGDVRIRRAASLQTVGSGTETIVFSPNGVIHGHIWAPELHYLDGRWYVYATGTVIAGQIAQRMFVLEGNSQDPMGSYTFKGLLEQHVGQLDPSPLVRDSDGAKFVTYSQWDADGQNLYIAPLTSPWTMGTPRVRIATPTFSWETNGAVNEGSIVLKRGAKTMIVYSGSGTWTPDYCLGMLVNTDGNYLNAASWTKASNPIFRRRDANSVYCVGHNGFTKSPSGAEDWIAYHGTNDPTGNQEPKRNVRIQRFRWYSNDTPNMDVPVMNSTPQLAPDEAPGAPERGLLVEFFNNTSLSGTPVVTGVNATLDFNWGTGAPVHDVFADGFSARWSGLLFAPVTGTHTFRTTSDDGVRLLVGGTQVISDWNAHPATVTDGTVTLTGGQFYEILLEYFENIGGAQLKLEWTPPGGSMQLISSANLFPPGNGLRGDYFSGRNFETWKRTRLDAAVDFDWAGSRPDLGVSTDGFSARWTGKIVPTATGSHTFHTLADDGVRLWVHGQQLINDWNSHPVTEYSGAITLTAGQAYDVTLEYFDDLAAASCRLLWTPPGGVKQTIPSARLLPPGPAVNTPPIISDVADQNLPGNTSTGAITYTVGDSDTPAASLTVSAASSNTTLVPPAGIVLGGSGANRTVTITPAQNRSGAATITLTVSDGSLTANDSFLLTVTEPPGVFLNYGFDSGTLQGWTDRTTANTNTGPRNWALSPPAFPTRTQNGAGAVGQSISGGTQDSAHPVLWLRSPEFHLNGWGDLQAFLTGGRGGGAALANQSEVPANSTSPGFQGIALRSVTTGAFVLTAKRTSSNDNWEAVGFSQSQLAALDQNAGYTLDLIDAGHGGWGWVTMDSVSIPGTLAPASTTLTVSIASSADDAEESASGTVNRTSTDLELVNDGAAGNQIVGVRFTGLTIPPGAVITDARIQFKADETQSTATTLDIAVHTADTAAAFTSTAGNLSSRTLAATSVLWQPPAWNTIGEASAAQRTPNLAALVQEIVSRPGWASGHAIAFLIAGTGHRTAEAFDKAGGTPPGLSVTYSTESTASYTQWLAGYPVLTGNNALRNSNPDGDEFNNLLEYALATNPAQSNPAPYTVAKQGNMLVFTYTRRSLAPDLTCTVEWSPSLAAGSWSTSGVSQQIISDNGPTQTVKATVPAITAKLFLRLRVTD